MKSFLKILMNRLPFIKLMNLNEFINKDFHFFNRKKTLYYKLKKL